MIITDSQNENRLKKWTAIKKLIIIKKDTMIIVRSILSRF